MLFDKYFDFQQTRETIADVPYQVLMQHTDETKLLEMDFGDKVARLVYKDVSILKINYQILWLILTK